MGEVRFIRHAESQSNAGLPVVNLAVLKVRFAAGGKAWLSGFPLARAGGGDLSVLLPNTLQNKRF